MGFYINPPNDETKEAWLSAHGTELTDDPTWEALVNLTGINPPDDDGVYVCLVDNGAFRAAGICFSEAEFDAFRAPDRGQQRPRTWYVVPRDKIIEVCPKVEGVLRCLT